MDRKETTKLLTDILIADRLSDRKYYAKEVTLDYGTDHPKRVDVMQFTPKGVIYPSDIEKGTFTCYEVKSCKEDIYSGNGIRFYGERNYFVMNMEAFNDIREDLNNGDLGRFIQEYYPESLNNFGILIPVPKTINLIDTNALFEEHLHPTEFKGSPYDWHLTTAITCFEGRRRRSMAELLFCMLRAKHSYTNQRDFL